MMLAASHLSRKGWLRCSRRSTSGDDVPTDSNGSDNASAPREPRKRDRAGTDRKVLDAALRLLSRDGVLAGLNLREVADEAGVNRGLIYQRYASRQGLLRKAIEQSGWANQPIFHEGRAKRFAERRQAVFDASLNAAYALKLLALLVLDASEPLVVFPMLDRTREDLARDVEQGALAEDVDPLAAHVMTAATYLGYAIYRDHFARDVGLEPHELDRRASVAFSQMLRGFTGSADAVLRRHDAAGH